MIAFSSNITTNSPSITLAAPTFAQVYTQDIRPVSRFFCHQYWRRSAYTLFPAKVPMGGAAFVFVRSIYTLLVVVVLWSLYS